MPASRGLVPRLHAVLGPVNAAHPWSHNAAHHRWILRQARAVRRVGGTIALDVGCGSGDLLARLASVFPDVTGLEPDPAVSALAAERVRELRGARVIATSFADRPPNRCDLVVLVAVLHHLPLESALLGLRDAVRPGGRLVVVGLPAETRADVPRSLLSLVLNPIVGLVRHPRRTRPGGDGRPEAPTADAVETFDEIGSVARRILPGVRLRRCLFWRYRMVWVAPR